MFKQLNRQTVVDDVRMFITVMILKILIKKIVHFFPNPITMTSSSPAACSPLTIKALSNGDVCDNFERIKHSMQTVQRIGLVPDAFPNLVHELGHCVMRSSFLGFSCSTLCLEVPPSTDGVDGPIGIVIVTRSAGVKVFTIAPSANDVSHINIQCSLSFDKPDTLSVVAQVVYNPASGRFPSAVLLEHSDVVGFDAVFVTGDEIKGGGRPVGDGISTVALGSDGDSSSASAYLKEVKVPMRVQLVFNLIPDVKVLPFVVFHKPRCSFVAESGHLTGSVIATHCKYD